MNADPFVFLIDTILTIYIFLILLRFLMQWLGASFYNPVAQFVVQATNPVLNPIRKLIPSRGSIDYGSLIGLFVVQALYGYLMAFLQGGQLSFAPLVIWTIGEIVEWVLKTFIVLIIVRAILSWIHSGPHNPAVALMYEITDPLLNLGRRMIPPISGIDLSPMVIIIGLEFLRRLLIPLFQQLLLSVQTAAF